MAEPILRSSMLKMRNSRMIDIKQMIHLISLFVNGHAEKIENKRIEITDFSSLAQ